MFAEAAASGWEPVDVTQRRLTDGKLRVVFRSDTTAVHVTDEPRTLWRAMADAPGVDLMYLPIARRLSLPPSKGGAAVPFWALKGTETKTEKTDFAQLFAK